MATEKMVRIDLEEEAKKGNVMYRTLMGMEVPYVNVNGYWLPALKYPEPKREFHLNHWGQEHMQWMEENQPLRQVNLRTTGTLLDYLMDIQEQAESLMNSTIKALAEQEEVTEELKQRDPMKWVARMEGIQMRAREIVHAEVIYQ